MCCICRRVSLIPALLVPFSSGGWEFPIAPVQCLLLCATVSSHCASGSCLGSLHFGQPCHTCEAALVWRGCLITCMEPRSAACTALPRPSNRTSCCGVCLWQRLQRLPVTAILPVRSQLVPHPGPVGWLCAQHMLSAHSTLHSLPVCSSSYQASRTELLKAGAALPTSTPHPSEKSIRFRRFLLGQTQHVHFEAVPIASVTCH